MELSYIPDVWSANRDVDLCGLWVRVTSGMADFRKFLLIGNQDFRLNGDAWQLDSFSWTKIGSIPNAADYDVWVLSLTALSEMSPPKVFTNDEIRKLFDAKVWLDVLEFSGVILIVGDIGYEFLVPASQGMGSFTRGTPRTQAVLPAGKPKPATSIYKPFQNIFDAQRDSRPVDYRRVSRAYQTEYLKTYRYLDLVKEWNYSMGRPCIAGDFATAAKARQVPPTIVPLATTNFGTCLAVHFQFAGGRAGGLSLFPPLGTSADEENKVVLEEFFGIQTSVASPAWSGELVLPGQAELQEEIKSKLVAEATIKEEREKKESELSHVQRWKRLLYDDGFGLEETVKEALEILGATVTKLSPEKDDYRVLVDGYVEGVLEVKGTRKKEFARKDLRQLSDWMDQAMAEKLAEVKGIFIGNASRESKPGDRGEMFDTNITTFAKLKKMALLRSVDLYCLVVLALVQRLDRGKFWKELFGNIGAFDAAAYRATLPAEFRFGKEAASENK